MRLKPLAEQVVVVMGASTGIGRLAARELARNGARVVVAARDEASLRSLVEEVERDGGQALAVPADVSVPEQVREVARRAEERFGGIDTWVNLAAASVYAPFADTTPEEFARVVSVDLLGYAYGMMAALPALRRRGGGAIVNVASVESRVALPFHSAYAAAKHGVAGLADALRAELRHERAPISVTTLMPASIDTPFFDHARSKLGVKPRPMPPVYGPERVVGAILHAAEHPVRELVVGGAGRLLIAMRRLVPGLTEAFLSRAGWAGQKTDQPRAASESDELYGTAMGDTRIREREEAPVGEVRRPGWLARRPGMVVLGVASAVLAAVGAARAFARER